MEPGVLLGVMVYVHLAFLNIRYYHVEITRLYWYIR